jgi:thymidylate synthase
LEHTWETVHLPKLEVSNLERGDVALCGSFEDQTALLPELDRDRIGFVAPLRSRSELEWLLRGLFLYPNIHQLVICGDDEYATGEALLALWQQGLEECGQLPGSRGRLPAELDAASLDTLRNDVQLIDLRGKRLSEVASATRDLPVLSGEREPRSLPNPQISERKVYHSRQTTFPIFSSDVGDSWLQLLNLALKIGTEKETADGQRIAEALNAVITIEKPELEDGKPQKKEEVFPDLFDFNRDDFDRLYLLNYEKRLRDWNGTDQLEIMLDRLKKSPGTRSGTMVFPESGYTTSERANAGANIASGLVSATFNTIDQKLFGSFVLRSTDLYTDWPLEATALVRLQFQMAERLGLEVGSATFVIHSAHIYEQDWERSQAVLAEHFNRPLPLHVDPSGIFLFGNDNGKATAMLLAHDASQIFWEQGFSDPEDLSWYIVDTMPWLLPQHIRYVGQECAALMRSMKENECYMQG